MKYTRRKQANKTNCAHIIFQSQSFRLKRKCLSNVTGVRLKDLISFEIKLKLTRSSENNNLRDLSQSYCYARGSGESYSWDSG